MPLVRFFAAAAAWFAFAVGANAQDWPGETRYRDTLDFHGTPRGASDRTINVLFDSGAWHGYSLPSDRTRATGFAGPFLLAPDNGRWIGRRFAEVRLHNARTGRPIPLRARDEGGFAAPGALIRAAEGEGVSVRQTLFIPSADRAVVRIDISSATPISVLVRVSGQQDFHRTIAVSGPGVVSELTGGYRLSTRLDGVATRARTSAGSFELRSAAPIALAANGHITLYLEQSLSTAPPSASSHDADWSAARARWEGYIAALESRQRAEFANDEGTLRVGMKAIQTLVGNWRAARGGLRHDGLFPSYSVDYFNGFWAWDSWKHAVALARFAPDLAKAQVRAMFALQNAQGMVPDVIYVDPSENNWRDTKPPLAAWAVAEIYRETQDLTFVAEMFDALVRYHRWWYADRDNDRDGLAEYGSTDGTRIAAAWESGMDNAVRFDDASMVRNHASAWSLNQESVDLNSYLYAEKLYLAELAVALGRAQLASEFTQEAAALRQHVRTRMFDRETGYFFDTHIETGAFRRVYGPEGWIPLWTGLASPDQARRVTQVMLDPTRFATHMPFPTLSADHSEFSPVEGYWRGPVWLDQAYFGVEALERYGFSDEARALRARLIDNAAGLRAQAPIYENYDPLTGNGYQARNFSWAAAHYFLLITR